ncbi:MAG: hypothetical protein ACFFCS_11465 [Candidatus Hodarchaeota archaeon]
MNALKIITETRENFTSKIDDVEYMRLNAPNWVTYGSENQIAKLYTEQDLLYNEGSVVWGHLIQANALLFEPGEDDHPCVLTYSFDERVDSKPKLLNKLATELYRIKGRRTDPELMEFSRKLASERSRVWKIPIPVKISEGIQCYYCAGMVIRKHLPKGYLSGSLFPFLVCPEKTDVGMILPSRYWPQKLINQWRW